MVELRSILCVARRLPILAAELLIRGYQVMLAPLLVGSCKFHPTCSEYCIQAIREWGLFRGSWLGFRRVIRCHPFSRGGLDPVPRRPHQKSTQQNLPKS
jgi:uncharacterized protein